MFVASEIIHARNGGDSLTRQYPWVVAFAFGLLHGFGFAGALAEVGLPESSIPMALLFFNVGVEIGQLLFVAAVIATIAAVTRVATAAAHGVAGMALARRAVCDRQRRQFLAGRTNLGVLIAVGAIRRYFFSTNACAIFTASAACPRKKCSTSRRRRSRVRETSSATTPSRPAPPRRGRPGALVYPPASTVSRSQPRP